MKQRTFTRNITGLIFILILVAADQITKVAAVGALKGSEDMVLVPGVLQLHYLENTGAAFSLFENQLSLFYFTTPILLLLLFYLFACTPTTKHFFPLWLAYIFLIAGAIGNFIDRMIYHYVIDFIYFSLIDFPVFNVADIYVTGSVVVLFYLIIFYFKDPDELMDLYLKRHKGM